MQPARRLWAGVKWVSGTHALAELLWLGHRGHVQSAQLAYGQADVPTLGFSLGRWAPTLRALLTAAVQACALDFLGGLQQLTFLRIAAKLPSAPDARFLSSMVQLRTLAWNMDVGAAAEGPLQQLVSPLPLPPRLRHLCLFGSSTAWDPSALGAGRA